MFCFLEEVMMRLFFMSLCVFIISKIFCSKRKEIPVSVYVISNIIAAILFAAGHIPSTMTMTALTSEILIRCFLFNGGLGLAFGHLYRKIRNRVRYDCSWTGSFGIRYSDDYFCLK